MKTLILICGLGVFAMLAEVFKLRKSVYYVVIAGLLAALLVNVIEWGTFKSWFNNMVFFDNYALAFSSAIIAICLLWILMSKEFLSELSRTTDLHALIMFSLAGAICMVSFSNLSMLFIGIEMLSIPLYVLAASDKRSARSNESGFKYFLMGAFATGFLLFGIALLYGVTGSFDISEINTFLRSNMEHPTMLHTGIFLIMAGLCFKVAAVPFHSWVPDVYEGAPSTVTAFMATIVKTAAFGAFLRLFYVTFADVYLQWSNLLWIICAISMLLGNIMAVYQNSLKRMLAYSAVAHAGYMLLAIVALNQSSASAMLLYASAYSLSTLAAFAFLIPVSKKYGSEKISDLRGLAQQNPLLAFTMTIAVLSMAGIPPVAGFFAKYYIFYTALQENYTWLIVIAIIASLIGVYYYFKVIIAMYTRTDEESEHIELSGGKKAFLIVISALILILGLAPNLIIDLL